MSWHHVGNGIQAKKLTSGTISLVAEADSRRSLNMTAETVGNIAKLFGLKLVAADATVVSPGQADALRLAAKNATASLDALTRAVAQVA